VLDTITNTGGGNFTAAVATLCSGGTTTISPKTLQECCLRFAAAKFCRDWRMHVDERKPVNVSGLFADDIEPFLIELTRTESDLDNNTGSVGIVVESFREFVMMHCPPASLLVSDGNYDLWRMVCMRRLCGNSPKTKNGGWCSECALEAEVSCMCSEIEEPRLTSKRPTVRAAARAKYEARKLACVPCNGDLAREPPKRDDVFDYAADGDDDFLGSGDELQDDSDSDGSAHPCEDETKAEPDSKRSKSGDASSDFVPEDDAVLEGPSEAYVRHEAESDMPLFGCMDKAASMTLPNNDYTMRWQAICNEHGWVVDAIEYPKVREGSTSIAMQLMILMSFF
jgi:hypothetical protein